MNQPSACSRKPGWQASGPISQLARFAAIGAVSTGCQYAVLLGLVLAYEFGATLASCIGFIASAVLNYYLNHSLTFKSAKPHAKAFPIFGAIAGIGLLLNGLVMNLLVTHFEAHYIAAQLVATAAVLIWSFLAHRSWTFGNSRQQ